MKTCDMCGEGFVPSPRHHKRQRFCSQRCQMKAWNMKNREGRAQYMERWREANPEAWRARGRRHHYRNAYGLSLEVADEILARGCEICGLKDGKLHIDHDHDTGGVRGCLCEPCNHGIGRFHDDPVRLRAAADYIDQHRKGGDAIYDV